MHVEITRYLPMQINVTAQPLLLEKLLTVACCCDCAVVDRRAEELGEGGVGVKKRGTREGKERG